MTFKPVSSSHAALALLMTLIMFQKCNLVLGFQIGTHDPDGRFQQMIEKKIGVIAPVPEKLVIEDDHRFPTTISAQVLGAQSLSESIPLKTFIPPRKPIPRKWIRMDEDPTKYWFHNKIHTFGNTNVFGGLHAAVAPLATRIIDDLAYEKEDVRSKIARELRQLVNKTNANVLDLCCGVGMSTRALASAFQDANVIYGIDTSPEMVSMARYITKHNGMFNIIQGVFSLGSKNDTGHYGFPDIFNRITREVRDTLYGLTNYLYPNCMYAIGNAERIKSPKGKFDLVTIMYAFHEIPRSARSRILREARRLLAPGGTLAIIDICPGGYKPSPSMLAGEPYVLEYLQNIDEQIAKFRGFHDSHSHDVVPGLLRMWTLTRSHVPNTLVPTLQQDRTLSASNI